MPNPQIQDATNGTGKIKSAFLARKTGSSIQIRFVFQSATSAKLQTKTAFAHLAILAMT
jgi:hypothetical protein